MYLFHLASWHRAIDLFDTGNRAKLPSDAVSAALVARAVCVLLTQLRVLSMDFRVICRPVGC